MRTVLLNRPQAELRGVETPRPLQVVEIELETNKTEFRMGHVYVCIFSPNETELSHRWRERAWQTF
jgi:hypothetical protein